MADETVPRIRILRAPKEGLLSQDMGAADAANLALLKRRVDVLMEEVRELNKYVKRSWIDKLLGK